MPTASIGQQKGLSSPQQCPTAHHTTNASKVESMVLRSFASSTTFTWPLANPTTTSLSISTTFCREDAFTNQQEAENAFQEFIKSWSTDFFFFMGINSFFIDKNVLIVMVPILINKDVFEPCYNDLKFMVWNHNYVCTNLILSIYKYYYRAGMLCNFLKSFHEDWVYLIYYQISALSTWHTVSTQQIFVRWIGRIFLVCETKWGDSW